MTGPSPGVHRRSGRAKATCVVALLMLLGGCGLWRPTPVPMRSLRLAAACTAAPTTLLVFLPGSYSVPEDYLSHGFVELVGRQHIAADIELVDAHLGYYSERSILDRLRDDVLAPARAHGYRDVWLVGISIGGYGALLHSATADASEPPLAGTVAIAPYLGDRRVSISVESSGGLAAWPLTASLHPESIDVTLWQWLQRETARRPQPRLYLGYGRSDRFEFSDRLLAAALPPAHVFTAPGGHDWPVWEALWTQMLPTLPLPRDPSCWPHVPP